MQNSQKVLQRTKNLKDKVAAYNDLVDTREDALTMIELAEEENDASMVSDVKDAVKKLKDTIEKLTLETLLSGQYDSSNAIMTFHAGAGGTEAQDWCEMLTRMYQMWAQKNGYKVEILDTLDGDEAGIKSCTIEVIGENAYGYFHGHEVGGTNPSLLEALGSTDLNLLLDVGFNKEVAEGAAVYWTKEKGSLAKLIDKADKVSAEKRTEYGDKAKQRIRVAYSWQYICDRYEEEFLK